MIVGFTGVLTNAGAAHPLTENIPGLRCARSMRLARSIGYRSLRGAVGLCVRQRSSSPARPYVSISTIWRIHDPAFDVPVGKDVESSGSYTALTPLAFLERSLDVFADKTAIAYGDRR